MKGKRDCPEFTTDFLNAMVNIFEVNFSSVFLETLFLNLKPDGIKFASTIAFQSIRKVEQIAESFNRYNCQLTGPVAGWCLVAKAHFEQLAYFSIFEQNKFMTQKVIEKTKDVESIFIENSLLANKVRIKQLLINKSRSLMLDQVLSKSSKLMDQMTFSTSEILVNIH